MVQIVPSSPAFAARQRGVLSLLSLQSTLAPCSSSAFTVAAQAFLDVTSTSLLASGDIARGRSLEFGKRNDKSMFTL